MKKHSARRHGRHRLSMDVPLSLYERIKASTTERNITVTKWMLRAIVGALKKEDSYR